MFSWTILTVENENVQILNENSMNKIIATMSQICSFKLLFSRSNLTAQRLLTVKERISLKYLLFLPSYFFYSDPYIYLSSEEVLRKCFGLFNVLSTTTSQWTDHRNVTPRKSIDLSLVFYREISLVREINLVFHFYLKKEELW